VNNNRRAGKPSADTTFFTERRNRLFAAIQPPGRGSYRNFEVRHALARRGVDSSAPDLSQLRGGTRNRPSTQIMELLAEFFGVRTEYFTDEESDYTRTLDAELGWLQLARDQNVRDVITALLALSPKVRDDLL
jgi:ESX-1-secreted protein regulator